MTSSPAGAKPRGLVARLRHRVGPWLPKFMRRAAAQLLNPFEVRGGVYDVAGHRLRFLPGSAPVVVQRGTDERQHLDALQLATFADVVQPGDVVADVGAYRGTYTLVAAACVGPRGHVVAFEPTTTNALLIARNVKLNKLSERVRIESIAVSDRHGVASFFADGDSSTNSFWASGASDTALTVRTTSLDDYFRGQQLPRVLKIDVEGAELPVLRGARTILSSDAVIICELHPYAWSAAGYDAAALRALLAQHARVAVDPTTHREIESFSYGVALLQRRD